MNNNFQKKLFCIKQNHMRSTFKIQKKELKKQQRKKIMNKLMIYKLNQICIKVRKSIIMKMLNKLLLKWQFNQFKPNHNNSLMKKQNNLFRKLTKLFNRKIIQMRSILLIVRMNLFNNKHLDSISYLNNRIKQFNNKMSRLFKRQKIMLKYRTMIIKKQKMKMMNIN